MYIIRTRLPPQKEFVKFVQKAGISMNNHSHKLVLEKDPKKFENSLARFCKEKDIEHCCAHRQQPIENHTISTATKPPKSQKSQEKNTQSQNTRFNEVRPECLRRRGNQMERLIL